VGLLLAVLASLLSALPIPDARGRRPLVILIVVAGLLGGAAAAGAIAARDRTVLAFLSFVLLNGITESSGFTTLANVCTLAFAIAATLPLRGKVYEVDPAYQRGFS
jgi:hypothetical protein